MVILKYHYLKFNQSNLLYYNHRIYHHKNLNMEINKHYLEYLVNKYLIVSV